MRCKSTGNEVMANSALLNFSRAAAHLPWRSARHRLPELRVVIASDRGACKIFQRPLRPSHQDVCQRVNDQDRRILRANLGVRQRQIEHADGFRIHRARHVETREIELCRGALLEIAGGSVACGLDQGVGPFVEISFAILAPFAEIEHRPHGGGRALGPAIGRRQRQAPRLAQDHLVGTDIGRHIVGVRTNGDAVYRFQQRELDKILPLDETARRRPCRHHEQGVTGVRIGEAMKHAGARHRHRDIGKRGVGDVSDRRKRLRRRLHGIGKGHGPVGAGGAVVARKRRQLRTVETEANRLASFLRHHADIGQRRTGLPADRLDIDRLLRIEYQPERIGTAEQCGRRSRRQRKCQMQPGAIAENADVTVTGVRFRFRRRGHHRRRGLFLDGFHRRHIDRLVRRHRSFRCGGHLRCGFNGVFPESPARQEIRPHEALPHEPLKAAEAAAPSFPSRPAFQVPPGSPPQVASSSQARLAQTRRRLHRRLGCGS